jgi:hypothetical protein
MLRCDEKLSAYFINPLKTEFPSHKNLFHTSKETHYIFPTKIRGLVLFRETIAVYCEKNMKQTQNAQFQHVKAAGTYIVSIGLLKIFD